VGSAGNSPDDDDIPGLSSSDNEDEDHVIIRKKLNIPFNPFKTSEIPQEQFWESSLKYEPERLTRIYGGNS